MRTRPPSPTTAASPSRRRGTAEVLAVGGDGGDLSAGDGPGQAALAVVRGDVDAFGLELAGGSAGAAQTAAEDAQVACRFARGRLLERLRERGVEREVQRVGGG